MAVAAIDAGTTGVRCMIVDKQGKTISFSQHSCEYSTPAHLEIAKEFDPQEFWKDISKVTRAALKDSGSSDVEAVSTTGQRMGMILLDADGKEIHGGPNIDARGALTQYVIEESLGERFHDITGCWPPMMFAPARITWFEEEEPRIYKAIAHILPINDWITYRLTGSFVTEPASASGTGFLDIQKRVWSEDILSVVGLEKDVLPKIAEAGQFVGELTEEAEKDTGLPIGLPVIQGSADTQCALLATQSDVGEVAVIAGSTAPIMLVLNQPICAEDRKIWTACHLVRDQWVLESNAQMAGACLDWAVGLLCERADDPAICKAKTLNNLSEIVADVPPGSFETIAAIGPTIMDCQRMTDIPQARLHFPQPALPQVIPLNSPGLLNAVLENIAYSVRGNVEQLLRYSEINAIKTIGGITKARVWSEMLANILGRSVATPVQSEGSLLGAAMCAANGIKWYPDFVAAAQEMVKWQPKAQPDDRADEYQRHYAKWTQIRSKGD